MADQTVDLTPEVVNVKVRRGDGWSVPVTLTGMNLTGYVIAAQLRETEDATTAVTLVITASAANLTAGLFYYGQAAAATGGVYDVQITAPGGLPRTYIAGYLIVDRDVTHA